MKVQQQSIDQFEQLNDELLTYSFSSQLQSPRNKTQQHNRVNISEHQKLKLQQDTNKEVKNIFFNKSYGSSGINGGQRQHTIRIGDAVFKSNFECGNLSMVDHIGHNTYRISLGNQINSDRMSLWFYFSCSGLKGQVTFMISGFTKSSSLYNQGMKICYRENGDLWRRGGSKIFYNRTQEDQQEYSLKFSFFFPNSGNNTYQFAYCFPYSFTKLLNFVYEDVSRLHIQILAKSYEQRAIPLLTIGNQSSQNVIFLSARVHPGQTVSSWIMEGFIRQLISENAHSQLLRKQFLFKIVPMLNPDGVCRGNYRFSGAGCDLNRKWKNCSSQKHPQIYYWKEYMIKTSKTKNVLMYIDIHGHSRKKNVFFYGCAPLINGVRDDQAKQFPYLMEEVHPAAYRYQYCCFSMPKDKQGTARLTMCQQLKNNHIYTLQSTFCGSTNQTSNFVESDYEKIGHKLVEGMVIYFSNYLHENNLQPKTLELLERAKQIKKKKAQELNKNPTLKYVGMADQSCSESDPERGQNEILTKYNKFNISSKNSKIKTPLISKRKENQRSLTSKLNSNLIVEKIKRKTFQKDKNNLQFMTLRVERKKDNTVLKNEGSIDQEVTTRNNYLTRPSTNPHRMTFEALKKATALRNFEEEDNFYGPNLQINLINTGEAIRRKLMLQRGGAQYRRVKKMAEQINRNNNHVLSGFNVPMIRGLVGFNNDLQLGPYQNKTSKTLANPHLYPNTSYGSRKGSIQFSLKKNMEKRSYPNSEENQVKCYGSKIPIHF